METKNKIVDNSKRRQIFSFDNILIYDFDKLEEIIYKYYYSGELKVIEYLKNDLSIIHNKKGESISSKGNEIDVFLENNYLELTSEDDSTIISIVFNWIDEKTKINREYAVKILNTLIRTNNPKIKTKAMQTAARNYFLGCLETLELELNNESKTDIYRGPNWDDFEPTEMDPVYRADTFLELSEVAIKLIKTKHNTV